MIDFIKWAFSDDAPGWVLLLANFTVFIVVFVWFYLSLVLIDKYGNFWLLIAPFAIGIYFAWREYKRREGDE